MSAAPMKPEAPEAPAPPAGTTVTMAPSSQSQGQTRPQVVPSSGWRSASAGVSVVLVAAVGAMLV